MPGMNPVVTIQLMQQYANYEEGPRTFVFTKNNLKRVHKETFNEVAKRKSRLSPAIREMAFTELNRMLAKSLKGRVGKVWIDPAMKKIAVPLETATGQTGYGILPTGSRVSIPDGKVVRAFIYWEKVNDIDLSCFAIDYRGNRKEFSWRSMWHEQSSAVSFSGDVVNGYQGGSEYFDINLKEYRKKYPNYRKLIFCANIYSDWGQTHYKDVVCTAGFMTRDEVSSGEVYEPKTVKSSFRINSDSSFAYLFGIDLETSEMVWLNLARKGNHAVAGMTEMDWLEKYFRCTDVIDVYSLYFMAGEFMPEEEKASLLVTDKYGPAEEHNGIPVVRSCDFEKILKVLTN